ncbi:MAG TPA: ribosomal protein S18-alanine N-acetyltransferase [Gammaproteobacteria bacterium]|jgi:ribosomal-protein-alanine N-acetyltransferase|nr:ribosomal protein S18-alanine N-acetyltransferase [Gammaproteobacteria bacterium]
MTIRLLSKNDLPRLLAIENAVHIVPWARDTFLVCFQAGCHGFVAVNEADEVIGFILATIGAGESHILNLCVDRGHQRQGHAKALLQRVEAEAKGQGVQIVHLEVRRSNTRAITLYEHQGYQQIGERKDYYPALSGNEDALLFAKML